jgi:dTDP-glucose 4,6-dehydratase
MREARLPAADLEEATRLAREDLLALRGANLFITGGTGYIGKWLLEVLLHADAALGLQLQGTVLTRDPAAFAASHPYLARADGPFRFVAGDVRGFELRRAGFTHAIHAATDVVVTNTPLDTFDVTVDGTRRVLEACRAGGVRDVLLLSSGAIYGRIPESMTHVPESYGGRPDLSALGAAYGVGKLATEWLGSAYSQVHGLACKSARVFAQVGPYLALDKQFAAGNFILDVLEGRPFVIKGDGTPMRSYMYGTDLAVWLLAILVRGRPSAAYNVGSDHGVSIEELAHAVGAAAGIATPEVSILTPRVEGRPRERYVPDISLARNELGLRIHTPLAAALTRTITWYRDFRGVKAS